jgi:hypothetical protein
MPVDLIELPDEVRSIARYPSRHGLAAGSLCALAAATLLALLGGDRPVFQPGPPPFDPTICASDPLEEPCLARLPNEMRRLPTRDQYVRWRTVDVVTDLQRSRSSTVELVGEAILLQWIARDPEAIRAHLERTSRMRIERVLERRDAWVRFRAGVRRVEGLFGYATTAPDDVRISLLAVGAERDWSAAPPSPDPLPSDEDIAAMDLSAEERVAVDLTALKNAVVREQVGPVVEKFAAPYARERWALLEQVWEAEASADAAREEENVRAHRAAEDRWTLLWCLAASATLVGAGLAVIWAALGPREVSLGMHRLTIGSHTFAWTEVSRVDWMSEPSGAWVGGRAYTLGPRTLSSKARHALTRASERALARVRQLDPADPQALEAVRKLLR